MTNPEGLKGGVYLLRIGPRRYYVGVTNDFATRRNYHLHHLRRGSHDNAVLQRSYNKHGEGDFHFDPVIRCDRETAAKVEAWLIQSNISDKNCVNLRIEDGATYTFSEESRRKMSEAQRRRPLASEETRRKRSRSLKGRRHNQETRRKLSEAARNRSPETRRRMSEAQRGKTRSEESRRKLSEALRGRTFSEEHRRKLSEAAKNMSPEHRRKLSEANRRRWAARKANQDTEEK